MIADFNENSSSSECQSNSMIQRASRRTKDRKSKTSGSRENLEQKENKRSYQVFSMVEGVYSRA